MCDGNHQRTSIMRHDHGRFSALREHRLREDHHSYAGDKGTVDPALQIVPAYFPGGTRLRVAELCTCSLKRTRLKWTHTFLYTWGATAVFQDTSRARNYVHSNTPGWDETFLVDTDVQEHRHIQ